MYVLLGTYVKQYVKACLESLFVMYRTRSNFRRLKLSRMSQIRDFRVFIFVGPHPVPLFFCSS